MPSPASQDAGHPRSRSPKKIKPPARAFKPNKPLSSRAPPAFKLGPFVRGGQAAEGKKKLEPRERRNRQSVSAAVEGDGGGGPTLEDGKPSPDLLEASKSAGGKAKQKVKHGRAYSPGPRPQPGRRPLDRGSGKDASRGEKKPSGSLMGWKGRYGPAKRERQAWWKENPPSSLSANDDDRDVSLFSRAKSVSLLASDLSSTPPSSSQRTPCVPETPRSVKPSVFPLVSPSPAGRRAAAIRTRVPMGSITSFSDVLAAVDEVDEEADGDETPVPIPVPSPFSRSANSFVRHMQPAQSPTPVPLGPTTRMHIALEQPLRNRTSLSVSTTPVRTLSPEKSAVVGGPTLGHRKRERSPLREETKDVKEDVGVVVERKTKKTRVADLRARAKSLSASFELKPTLPLSTFKVRNPPLVTPEPSSPPASSSASTEATMQTSSFPYNPPRWFMPPNSFYFATAPLPQRPVLGMDGKWHKPQGVFPPGGGAKDSRPPIAPTAYDKDEIEFVCEISRNI